MLSIGKLTSGREDYYLTSLAATGDEYYLDPTEIPGVWHGQLAGRLGLSGTVEAGAFRAVLDGRHPDGTPLVLGAGGTGRVTGFDLTFSAPKSVTLLWALGDPDIAAAVVAAHDGAVADAFAVFEAEAVRARRGHAGATVIPGEGLVAAAFGHRTSRGGDPQLHTHLVTANLTVGADGRWSAPDGRAVYGWVKTTGYLYQAGLRARLTETLGVTWTPVRKGVAEIDGITPAQRDCFSTRRAEITAEMERLGYTSTAAARTATLTTRPAKDRTVGLDQLRRLWAEQAVTVDLDVTTVTAGREGRTAGRVNMTDQLLSADGLTAQATSFDRRHVYQALATGHGDGAHPATVREEADRFLAHPDVVELGTATPAGGRRHTTAELLAVEAHLLAMAVDTRRAPVGIVSREILDRVLEERPGLSDEQPGDGHPIGHLGCRGRGGRRASRDREDLRPRRRPRRVERHGAPGHRDRVGSARRDRTANRGRDPVGHDRPAPHRPRPTRTALRTHPGHGGRGRRGRDGRDPQTRPASHPRPSVRGESGVGR
jgi:conjugative relaxase-like TrwC/TraI family protein